MTTPPPMSKSGRESPELPKTKRPRIGSPPAPAAITTLLDPISSRTRLAKRKTTVQRSPVWVEKVGKGKHQPASSAATQEEVGEWLGLFDMIEATDKGKQVLSDEEAELIACAVDHNAVVDDTHIFTPTQIIKQTRDRTTDEGCQCQLHSAIRTMSDTDEFHRLLQELLALMSENSGEVMSGNGANIAITLIKYILQKAGFYSVQVLMEGKSSIAAKRSTHARCTVGVGSGKEEKSIVIDSTPDFFGRSLHTARAVYIFVGEVESPQATRPLIQLALNTFGVSLKQGSSHLGAVLLGVAPLRADVCLCQLEDSEDSRRNVSFRRVNYAEPYLLTRPSMLAMFASTLVDLVNIIV